MTRPEGPHVPPRQRDSDGSSEQEPNTQTAAASGDDVESNEPNLEHLASMGTSASAPSSQPSQPVSALEEMFFKDDFLRTVLIGCAGGFGLSTLVIIFSLEVTTLRSAMTQQLGLWWFVVPLFTVVGFVAWTFMLIRIRRHRFTKLMRKQAFDKQASSSSGPEAFDADDAENEPHDSSQEDWL